MEGLDAQKNTLRVELREAKHREQRLLNDYSELEEENISLQKTVRAKPEYVSGLKPNTSESAIESLFFGVDTLMPHV